VSDIKINLLIELLISIRQILKDNSILHFHAKFTSISINFLSIQSINHFIPLTTQVKDVLGLITPSEVLDKSH
jgi:hypothetical protein